MECQPSKKLGHVGGGGGGGNTDTNYSVATEDSDIKS